MSAHRRATGSRREARSSKRAALGRDGVVDASRRPLEGAEIAYRLRAGGVPRTLGSGETDSEGRFELRCGRAPWSSWDCTLSVAVDAAGFAPSDLEDIFEPAPGLVTLGVEAADFQGATDTLLVLRAASKQTFDFTLAPESLATVQVVDYDSRPLANAEAGPPGRVAGKEPWLEHESTRSFWRAPERTDGNGTASIRGLPEGLDCDVRLRAPGFRESFVSARSGVSAERLARRQGIDVIGERLSGHAPVEWYEIRFRDGPRPGGLACGLGESLRWVHLQRDSLAVEVLSPHHWRVDWNGSPCFVRGGFLALGSAVASDGSHAEAVLRRRLPG